MKIPRLNPKSTEPNFLGILIFYIKEILMYIKPWEKFSLLANSIRWASNTSIVT